MSEPIQSPVFVGRREEIESLAALLRRAADGEPGFAIVAGEAGVGKTRLVTELAGRAADSGFTVLAGHCVELGAEGLPLAPLIDALRTLARTSAPAELADVLGPARRGLGRLLPELDPGALLAQNQGAEPAVDGLQVSQLLELVLGLLGRLSARRPLLLVLEDLHWSDQSTRELVAFLIRSLRGVRVVLLATYRSDELNRRHPLRPLIASWDRVRTVQHVELRRFEPGEVAAQLGAILGTEPAAGLVDLVFDRSGGNAYLMEELAGLVRGGGDPADLPPSLADVLLSRVDALSPEAQRLLRTAAVAGRSVPDKLLAEVAGVGDAEFYAGLREAVESHLLVVDHTGRSYAFRHALTRDAVYEDMLPGERGGLHAAYGEALTRDPDLAGNLVESLLRLGRWSEADQLATQAVNAMPEGVFAATVLQLRAELAAMTGRYADADTDVRSARRALGQTHDEQFALTLLYCEALVALGRGDPGAARRATTSGLAEYDSPISGRYIWPVLWLAARAEADEATRARDRREDIPDDTAARHRDLASRAAGMATPNASSRGYQALVTAELARAAGSGAEADAESSIVGAWSAAAAAWQAAAEPYPLAYSLLRLAEAAAAAGDRQAAAGGVRQAYALASRVGAAPIAAEATALARRTRLSLDQLDADAAAVRPAPEDPLARFGLTEREREILVLLAAGRSNPQIAETLFISPKTASVHVSNILAKLGVDSRVEAAAVAHRLGVTG